ncbi:PP2C family protein-serine/threonine phosphatase [Streptomyces sp. NPDC058657]|uniref:PP2C family protein-serine/threonine phosphatase n=1 Tax=unclassified Streptomyces TaxID=2593676 RepID=UPI0036491EA1
MSAPNVPKVAGIDPLVPSPAQTPAPAGAVIQDRLAGWVSDLTTLHELTERLVSTGALDEALHAVVEAGATLVGARRGLAALEPADGLGPASTVGLGLTHAELGHLETVPRRTPEDGDPQDPAPGPDLFASSPDLLHEEDLDPLHREVAARVGYAASYALDLTGPSGTLGSVVWLYDDPAEPPERRRHLVGLYVRYAAEHLARLVELERARARVAALTEELLPSRLPRVTGVRMAVRHHAGPHGGGDWYDALPLPEGALGLTVGSVTGSGPGATAAMGRLRASLRAYAVMEGEDPVAVLSDLELLMRLTEPARSATALLAYCEPAKRKILLSGAGHCPPLIVGARRTEYAETTLSAPLGMLSCWEAPSAEIAPEPGESVLLYTEGLLRRTRDPMDRAFARLHAAAAGVPKAAREDPGAIADHILRTMLPDGPDTGDPAADIVLLAARFD